MVRHMYSRSDSLLPANWAHSILFQLAIPHEMSYHALNCMHAGPCCKNGCSCRSTTAVQEPDERVGAGMLFDRKGRRSTIKAGKDSK